MCIFFAFVKYSVRVATNHLSRPHQPSSAVLHFSISFRHYSQWIIDKTIYSTNIQNEDDQETISGSANLEIRKIHIATEQEERLIDNIFIVRCDSHDSPTTLRDVGTGATPRTAAHFACFVVFAGSNSRLCDKSNAPHLLPTIVQNCFQNGSVSNLPKMGDISLH